MPTIPGYSTPEIIYEGRKSTIYRATRLQTNQPVIIKLYNNKYPTPEEYAQFQQEYNLTARFDHQGIVKVYELITVNKRPAIIMEDFAGQSFTAMLESCGRLDLEDFLQLAVRIGEVIGEIHRQNIIHKDINPSNIIYNTTSNTVKIIDFGIATALSREMTAVEHVNTLEGTPAYISPEQTGRMNRSLDYRTDFYSLGATFYRMLTGCLPFTTTDPMELVYSHIARLPESPHALDDSIPESVSRIIMKLMEKNEEDRYQSTHGLITDLFRCIKELQETGTISVFMPGTDDVSDRFKLSQKLYGREAEVDTLISTFERVGTGTTELMLVAGFSGIGKSTLINEIHKSIVTRKGFFISGKFERLKKDVPYSAFIRAFTGLIHQILAEPDNTIALWKDKLLAALGPNGKLITEMIPELELIIGKQPDVPELGQQESQNRFKLVIKNFIKIFANTNHMLVLFLDDLQWADLGSLSLLKLFLTDPDLPYLFIIGAYRHNEMSAAHPLKLTIDEIKKTTTVNAIFLEPLKIDDITRLLSDSFTFHSGEIKRLAELIHTKTRGNPFFIIEFLKTLYKERLLEFIPKKGWQWDMERIRNVGITDNVADLLSNKISELSPDARQVIMQGSCIGAYFSFDTLAMVSDKPADQLRHLLYELMSAGMIDKRGTNYTFVHDRIQGVAYSLIDEDEKIRLHYRIGTLELEQLEAEALREKLFYIVNQLNAGLSLVNEETERMVIMELNLTAGEKALASNAYASAFTYFQTGLSLLSADSWEARYTLTLSLYQQSAIAAQLNADYDTMERLADSVCRHAHSVLDTVKVYGAKISACKDQDRHIEAIDIARILLKQLGVKLPRKITNVHMLGALLKVKRVLFGKSVEYLRKLPDSNDRKTTAISQVENLIGTSLYYALPELLPYTILDGAYRAVKNRTGIPPITLAYLGLIYCGVLGDITTGTQMGKLAMELVQKKEHMVKQCRVQLIYAFFIRHWTNPLRDSAELAGEAYFLALENGDLEFAGISGFVYCAILSYSGIDMEQLEQEIITYTEAVEKLKQENTSLYALMLMHQYVKNLRETSGDPCAFEGPYYDERVILPEITKSNNKNALFTYYSVTAVTFFYNERYAEALERSMIAGRYLESVVASPVEIQYYFENSLIILAHYQMLKKSHREKMLKRVAKNQRKLKSRMKYNPQSFSHKYHLVQAEINRVTGNESEARKQYEKAISLARQSTYIHEEAIALHLAGKFWFNLGMEKVAALYLTEAHHTYRMWGANRLVQHIETHYHDLLTMQTGLKQSSLRTISENITDSTDTTSISRDLDFTTIIKTAYILASETNLDKLLASIMKLSLENAGAERGFLIIQEEEDNKLTVEVEGDVTQGISIHPSIPLDDAPGLSPVIVNYVNRTNDSIVLHNACKEGDFTTDMHLIKFGVKSLLCMPITYKNKTAGILYLENTLSTHTFTDERLEILKILSVQAAISLENARLLAYRENAAKLEREMEIAATIQSSLLPPTPVMEGYEIEAYINPADDVGGDYYDVINTKGRDWVIIGDVSGHGVPAGLVMMMVQTSIHNTLNILPDLSPAELLSAINTTITRNIKLLGETHYMTITVFATHQDGRFTFSGRHEDIMIYRAKNKAVDVLNSKGMWIGFLDSIGEFLTDDPLDIHPGDIMLVFTDGVIESIDKTKLDQGHNEKTMFGTARLEHILNKFGAQGPARVKEELLKALDGYACADDVTFVLLKRLAE